MNVDFDGVDHVRELEGTKYTMHPSYLSLHCAHNMTVGDVTSDSQSYLKSIWCPKPCERAT